MDLLSTTLLLIIIIVLIFSYKTIHKISKDLLDQQEKYNKTLSEHSEYVEDLKKQFEYEKKQAKKVALTGSRNTIKGQMSERYCPFQSDFLYAPEDCHFMGKPLDFIVFKNIEKYREDDPSITLEDIEVIFLEIKTGKSSLTKVEKAIKYAIDNKKVSFQTYHYNDNFPSTPTINEEKKLDYQTNFNNSESSKINQDNKLLIKPLDFTENDKSHRTEAKQPYILRSREIYPRTSYKWSNYEIDFLIQKYDEGYNLTELSALFQRTPGGISSRLEILGVQVQLDE
ncbi:Holliday junction resolvase-like protein [Acinetobacter pseudolwoffii]|uniref:Holliday junction resolvase-like protein n=1 Tax=Acinetobacter pseudolwoffii TaxID=2053287 RepID=UPI003523F626